MGLIFICDSWTTQSIKRKNQQTCWPNQLGTFCLATAHSTMLGPLHPLISNSNSSQFPHSNSRVPPIHSFPFPFSSFIPLFPCKHISRPSFWPHFPQPPFCPLKLLVGPTNSPCFKSNQSHRPSTPNFSSNHTSTNSSQPPFPLPFQLPYVPFQYIISLPPCFLLSLDDPYCQPTPLSSLILHLLNLNRNRHFVSHCLNPQRRTISTFPFHSLKSQIGIDKSHNKCAQILVLKCNY